MTMLSNLAGHEADPSRRPARPRGPVVVAVDGSHESAAAVEWAAAEAASRQLPLKIVHCWEWHVLAPLPAEADRIALAERRSEARAVVAAAVELASATERVDVSPCVIEGLPAEVLCELAKDAELVVLGARRQSAVSRAVLGSVSSAVVARAACPVVVLCAPPGLPGERPSVVVGVSGEEHDEQVLRFAFEHASRAGLPLKAVLCWHPPLADETAPPPERARVQLAEALAGWGEAYPDVELHATVRRGSPVETLVRTAASQDLLVVGRHARRIRFGTLLGSVSLGVLHHATCPVAVIPPE
jgi:nucleotide-binding universal stress UspA family protein